MYNIIDFAKANSDKSFSERPFCMADALILAALSYVNFDRLDIGIDKPDKKLSFAELGDAQIEELTDTKLYAKRNKILLEAFRESKRYSDIGITRVMNILDDVYTEQFFAVTFCIPGVGNYISYRGTDCSAVGWKEDFLMLTNTTAAQLDTIEYIYQISDLIAGTPLYVGGHSKGGNLALYAGLHMPDEYFADLVSCYSFDGPGFADKKFKKLARYEELLPKYQHIMPADSLAGELLHTPNKHSIIRASGRGMAQHNMFFWYLTEDGDFEYLHNRTLGAKVFHRALKGWSCVSSTSDKQLFIEILMKAFSSEEGEFLILSKKGGSKIGRIFKALKDYPFKKRLQFFKIILPFGVFALGALLHYALVAISGPFKKLFKKTE